MNDRNLVELFLRQADHLSGKIALKFKSNGEYRDLRWNSFRGRVYETASALKVMGVERGDRVGILSENRPEWTFADLGVLTLGGILVPIHATSSAQEAEHILSHSGAKLLFLSTDTHYQTLKPILKNLKSLKKIILFDLSVSGEENVMQFDSFLKLANSNEKSERQIFLKEHANKIEPDHLATIIYTSGTTGPSKGVPLTHRNLLTNCYDTRNILPIDERDLGLSFLPLSHIFERMGGYYLSILCGATIAYAENMNTVGENLKEVSPTVACAVPRFFEKIQAQIMMQAQELPPLKRLIFNWAVEIGKKYATCQLQGKKPCLGLSVKRHFAQALVFNKIIKNLGGRLRFFVSGGAPLQQELGVFFYSLGILVLEGYGLTETSPVIAVNRPDRFKFGSVGIPLPSVEVKISDDGEVLVRGNSVMSGYYQNAEATRAAFCDGWFCTGDLGEVDSDGFLHITGRKKDIIVNSAGKKISPQNIEQDVLVDPAISQIVLIGDKRNFITALIVPQFNYVSKILALDEKITPNELVARPEVHALVRKALDEQTKNYAAYEQIRYFTLLAREFSPERDEMTLTLKIKRKVVSEHFKEAIERMYERASESRDEARAELFYVT